METFSKIVKQCKKQAPYFPYPKGELYIDVLHRLMWHLAIDPLNP